VGGFVRFIDDDWSGTMTTVGLTSSAGKSEALTGWIAGNWLLNLLGRKEDELEGIA